MAQDRIAEQVAGVVTCSNAKGFQLEGRDGWLNISKFGAGVEIPVKGAHVVTGLDKAGFVRSVEPMTTAVVNSPGAAVSKATDAPDKETRIGRMAAINSSIALLSSGGRSIVDVATVLGAAAQLEQWVNRPADDHEERQTA